MQNPLLSQMLDRLEFAEERRSKARIYQRDDRFVHNLLAVIRIRTGSSRLDRRRLSTAET